MVNNWTLLMSINEIKRCGLFKMANEKQTTQLEGAKRIGVTEWHFRRILQKYRKKG